METFVLLINHAFILNAIDTSWRSRYALSYRPDTRN